MPLCLCVWACTCKPCIMGLNFLESEKNGMWLQSMERLHLENKLYDKSFLFWYSDWQSSNAAVQRGAEGEKQRIGKIEVVSLYLSCPKLSHSAASGGFCQLAADFCMSLPFYCSIWTCMGLHLRVCCLEWLGLKGGGQTHIFKIFTISRKGKEMWAHADWLELKAVFDLSRMTNYTCGWLLSWRGSTVLFCVDAQRCST